MLAPLRIAASASVDIAKALGKLPGGGKKGKKRVKKAFNGVYTRCEDAGLIPRMPDYLEDYGRDYPELLTVEAAHADIRRECERLLTFRSGITDMSKLGGQYTERGIHTIQWKAFMLKSGTFIEENCALAPKTAAVLRPLTNVYNAFFSIVEPHQYITPHWGYYKGFLRYHLGVIIPADNADQKCWLRVNVDRADNAKKDKSLIERAAKYHWRNGKGVMFDDTNLHDAANESDEVRVVLWLDVARKFPRTLDLYNRALLKAVYYEPSVKKFRENAVVHLPDAARA
jgi:aspartyl/asparaginyl beta-hydroxylase (cupin superfamily)